MYRLSAGPAWWLPVRQGASPRGWAPWAQKSGDAADVAGPQHPYVLTGAGGADAAGPVGDGLAADPHVVEQLGQLPVEVDVLAATEDDEVVGQPEQRAGLVLAVGDDHLLPGLGGVDKRQAQRAFVGHPHAQGGQRRG